ncbi:hypothetical protein NE237_023484 [Protea cynaroides]|uniref:Uncharacterized protein n=1 Tax=Protea cynaroides TaxID=273540 RepID=A0A9Q0K666_9MAGN|nr:hypothetical protein NE237_023484 [Protea cynaroides]
MYSELKSFPIAYTTSTVRELDSSNSLHHRSTSTVLELVLSYPLSHLIANTCCLVNQEIGVKTVERKSLLLLLEACQNLSEQVFIVLIKGFHILMWWAVSESADFLVKDRELPTPAKCTRLVVHDAGTYCMGMASHTTSRCGHLSIS